jgi:bifunctional non-homologous end joining protein LigD
MEMLTAYRKKRDFNVTSEPSGGKRGKSASKLAFVVQKHAASHLHYDFRLELDGVLKSWAVPKGPSLDPAKKSLAVEVEDHPLEYGEFEGTIPKGQYGGGSVLLWDRGTWEPLEEPHVGLKNGKLHFALHGEKLQGEWTLVRFHGSDDKHRRHWLLMKNRDEHAESGGAILEEKPASVKSNRLIEAIGKSSGKTERQWTDSMPTDIRPQLATWTSHPPSGDQWLHEVKLDGYRLIARIEGGKVQLITRGSEDWTHRFPRLSKELSEIPGRAILDGEVVVLDEQGRSQFQLLQNTWKNDGNADPVIFLFDLLYRDRKDLRDEPLLERKKLLRPIVEKLDAPRVKFNDHVLGDGEAVVDAACRMHLEGIVSKRIDARYVGGRTQSWVKSKCGYRQEFVIIGYTDPRGSRQEFGSLLLGYHDSAGRLVYAGRVGTGFDASLLKEVKQRMAAHARTEPPTNNPPPARERRMAHWIEPELVAEVKFAGWTGDKLIRQGAFMGLRQDKPASEIVREDQPQAKLVARKRRRAVEPVQKRIEITHPDRIVFPGTKITKSALAGYYESVAQRMLPHVVDRPLTIMRYPSGIGGPSFIQRHTAANLPAGIEGIEAGAENYLMIRNPAGLRALVQMNAIEIHAWGCASGKPEAPDRLVFDLDPDVELPWSRIVKAARELKEILESVKLRPVVKTTGGKGLHVIVPIKPTIDWDRAKGFSKSIAEEMARRSRDEFTTNLRKANRTGRIFIDYLRNGRSATAVAPYSVRARAGAPVSMPVDWEELSALKGANRFTLVNAARHLKRQSKDPWAKFESDRVDLVKVVGETK